MEYIFYICLGLLPSLLWLSYYLRKDKNPEPNSVVVNIFIWGMLLAPLAIIIELVLIWLINPDNDFIGIIVQLPQNGYFQVILAATLIPAITEEYLKYAIVRFKFLRNPAFDEPTDIILYCVIVGLGFAAIENLMILFQMDFPNFSLSFKTIILRFLGATLVHALASATVGYWLALGLQHKGRLKTYTAIGLAIAIFFHSCYNYFIVTALTANDTTSRYFFLAVIGLMMIAVAITISACFKKLKKQKPVCAIKQ